LPLALEEPKTAALKKLIIGGTKKTTSNMI